MNNVVILPVSPIERGRPRPEREGLVAKVRIGPHQHIRVHAFTADEMCVPLVELRGVTGHVDNLTVDQAEAIGRALLDAAAKAKGTE